MLNNQYDTDCGTFNPKGKVFQVEYAMEAVKYGSICVGLRSDTHAVLCAIKKSTSELADYQEKIFKVDDKIGMAMSGIVADGRILCKFLRNECLNHRYVYDSPHPIQRLVNKVAEKSQHKTQSMYKRPYGVSLLVIGADQDGPHLFETQPSGEVFEYHAYALGQRNQSARTYLEGHFKKFPKMDLERLILHGIKALSTTSQDEHEMNEKNLEIAIVGVKDNENFKLLSHQDNHDFLQRLSSFKPEGEMQME